MKDVAFIVLALLTGLAAGLGTYHFVVAKEPAPQDALGPPALDAALGPPAPDGAGEELQRLEAENTRLHNELRQLREALTESRAALAADPAAGEAGANEAKPPVESLLGGLLAGLGPAEQEQEEERPPWHRWDSDDEPGRAESMREHIRAMLDARRAQTTDPAEQERIAALMEYTDYLAGLREQMRNAETEQERDALRAEFFTAIQDVRQIMEQQRQSAFSGLASRYGITDARQQERFLRDMRQVLDDPLTGGGFGGRGFGRSGGGAGRGFGPR